MLGMSSSSQVFRKLRFLSGFVCCGVFCPALRTFGIPGDTCVYHSRGRGSFALLASSGWKADTLPNVLQCMGPPPPNTTKKCPAPNVSGALVEKLCGIESKIVEQKKVTMFKKEKILELSTGFECLQGSERGDHFYQKPVFKYI